MALLTKDQILASDDTEYTDLEVPEWGGTIRIAVMSGWARDRYEAMLYRDRDKLETVDNLRARFLSFCMIDENGDLMFTEADILELGQKSSKALGRIFDAATELNNTGVEGLEEAAKNS